MARKLTNDEFQKRLRELNTGVYTNDEYNGYRSYLTCYCDNNHTWQALASNILQGCKCPYCSGQKIWKGFNDLWTTYPEIAKLLTNPNDGYTHSHGCGKNLSFTCPDCGYVSEHTIHNVINANKVACPRCSDGISFANKFMLSALGQTGLEFEYEYSFDGISYRYDFFLIKQNVIIEMHGRQHYQGWGDKHSLENIQETDRLKHQCAIKNGVHDYIVIDCQKSDLEYILNNIIKSNLSKYVDIFNIDWQQCLMYASSSMIKIVADLYNEGYTNMQIVNKIRMSHVSVWRWLNVAKELGLCDYTPINKFTESKKQVICVTTNEIFESILSASKKYNLQVSNVSKVCKHKLHCKSAGKDPVTGEPLKWMYLEDYENQNAITIQD